MRNLNEKWLVQEMELQEMKEVNGGVVLLPWGTIMKVAEKLTVAIGLADAGERFINGWNAAGDSLEYK